ncbi:UNVERIFIED_CONTAM: hypothetical protein Scaly_3112900 [Sesamum calycinum]|uniref:Uncharacterized protein n=1 Tax=Sesamum calycinum TaxID=2727403 RepID=A0AAW2JKE6_9LAMI
MSRAPRWRVVEANRRKSKRKGSLLDPFPSLPHCSSKCATPYEDLLLFCPLSVHTVLKAEEKGGQQVPRALCPTHLSRSKCSSPVPPNAPISRQRSCECAVMLRMLRHRIDRPSSRSSGALALYLRHTRKDAVGRKQPSLCPADHSAGISHSRPRLTAARGWPSRIGKSLPFPSNDPASPGSSTVRSPFPPYAPPAQAYHASRLRRFRQTVFASSAILPAGCMGGLSLAAAFC